MGRPERPQSGGSDDGAALERSRVATETAFALLQSITRDNEGLILPVTANAFRLAWERVKGRAKIDDLHFHDLRHEAISRFFEMGLDVCTQPKPRRGAIQNRDGEP